MQNDVLISKNALMLEFDWLNRSYPKDCGNEVAEKLVKLVEQAPAVDAELVRHGRWMPYYEPVEVFVNEMLDTEIIDTQTGWICSECGKFGHGGTLEEMPYCHCGCKMDAEVQDG